MTDVKWIKLASDVFENRKIKVIEHLQNGDAIIIIWFKILCLAGQINDNGLLYLTDGIPFTDEMIADQIARPIKLVRQALSIFEQYGMIERIEDVIYISNWEKYQSTGKMERIREQTKARVTNYRARQKNIVSECVTCNASVTQDVTHHVTQSNATDIDIDIDIDKDIDIYKKEKNIKEKKKATLFEVPTVDEIKAYCEERKSPIEPNRFFDYYESQGWVLSNGQKMKDWKAAIRNWESREKPKATQNNDTHSWMKGYTKK